MLQRSLTIDVWLEDDEQYGPVRASIARYRAACRQMFGVLACSQAAGATITERKDDDIRLTPSNERATTILNATFDKGGKAAGYSMRQWFLEHLYQTALSFVWDSARRQVTTRWRAKDPEFPKAGRGWLVLQGARGVAEFHGVGIEFPQATARPKLDARSIRLKWDHSIGELTFQFGKLDPARWNTWTQIRDGEWPPGTVSLNERDGKLRVTLTYEKPEAKVTLDPTRVLTVTVRDVGETVVVLSGGDESDEIRVDNAVAVLAQLVSQRRLWESRKESVGNPKKPWGVRRQWRGVQEHLSRVTLSRERFVADCNHAWARRIVSRAKSWLCGTIRFEKPERSELAGHPWNWSQFRQFVAYKATEAGSSLTTEALESQGTHTT